MAAIASGHSGRFPTRQAPLRCRSRRVNHAACSGGRRDAVNSPRATDRSKRACSTVRAAVRRCRCASGCCSCCPRARSTSTSASAAARRAPARSRSEMGAHEHHAKARRAVACAIVTVSDTRTPETDGSGTCIRTLLEAAGHRVLAYAIRPDDPGTVRAHLEELLALPGLDAVIVNGGTGIAPRDTTFEAITGLLEKRLEGFG